MVRRQESSEEKSSEAVNVGLVKTENKLSGKSEWIDVPTALMSAWHKTIDPVRSTGSPYLLHLLPVKSAVNCVVPPAAISAPLIYSPRYFIWGLFNSTKSISVLRLCPCFRSRTACRDRSVETTRTTKSRAEDVEEKECAQLVNLI